MTTPVAERIPAGYSSYFRASPLTDPWEPLYSKAENGAILLALRIRQPIATAGASHTAA
jgi:hypothetical protein